jgi:hypothetical protein
MELTRWRPKYRQELRPDHTAGGGGCGLCPTWGKQIKRLVNKKHYIGACSSQ